MLIDTIRAASLAARKERDATASNLLSTLVSEAAMVGKNDGNRESTDEEVLATVRKFLKNAEETREKMAGRGSEEAFATNAREIDILKGYMPTQMSADELREAIEAFRSGNPGAKMGDVMSHLKATHGGQYDGKTASSVVKQVLAS